MRKERIERKSGLYQQIIRIISINIKEGNLSEESGAGKCRNSHKRKANLAMGNCSESDFNKRGALTHPRDSF